MLPGCGSPEIEAPQVRRVIIEAEIQSLSPRSLRVASGVFALWGFVAACATFWPLAGIGMRFRVSVTTMLILMFSGCVVLPIVGLVLAWGVRRAKLWAWFATFSCSTVASVLTILLLGIRIRDGLSPLTAMQLTPSLTLLGGLSLVLLVLLSRRDLRAWLASARELRSLSDQGLDQYLAGRLATDRH